MGSVCKSRTVLTQLCGLLIMMMAFTVPVSSAQYYMLTDLGSSAEMIGYGGVEGFTKSSNSIFENPAGLYRVKTLSTHLFATQLFQEVTYANVSMAYNYGGGVVAFGYMGAGVSDIPRTASSSSGLFYEVDTFEYKNHMIKAAYQYSVFENVHLGTSLTGYLNNIYTISGTGFNVDAGAIATFGDLSLSLFARNLIPQKVIYTDTADEDYSGEEDLPLQVITGIAYPLGDILLYGQSKYDGDNILVAVGGTFNPGFLDMLTFSMGYREYSVLDAVKSTFTLGVGLDLFGFKMDYAYEKSEHYEFDSNNYFSTSFNF